MSIFKKVAFLVLATAFLSSCASSYQKIQPQTLNYVSVKEKDGVKLQYKYELLSKKYAKKELKKGVKLVALKITNNTDSDLTFGSDLMLTYENGNSVYVMQNERVFKTLKQSPASYLWYLLLTPMQFTTTETTNGFETDSSSFPIGFIIGPGLTATNMIISGGANSKFKEEMLTYNINGTVIKAGETKYGLVGIDTDTFEALSFKLN